MSDISGVLAEIEDHLDDDDEDAINEHVFMEPAYQGPLPPPPTNNVVSRNAMLKNAGNAVSTVGSYGVGIAQIATASPGVLALATGATIAGAGPIGLLVASLVFTVGFSVQAGVSAAKTHQHIQELEKILAGANGCACGKGQGHDHCTVRDTILPYIIAKKKAKRVRKAFSTVPFAVSLETARAAGKAAWKKFRGTKGKARTYYAQVLARHHCTSDCALTAAIIQSLFWVDEDTVDDLRGCDLQEVAPVLAAKMKSV